MEWFKKAGIRAIKTFAQTMLSFIVVGKALNELDWVYMLSVSAVALIASILTSVVGLPELKIPEVVGDIAVNPDSCDAMIHFSPENAGNLKLDSQVTFNVVGLGSFELEDVNEEGDGEE